MNRIIVIFFLLLISCSIKQQVQLVKPYYKPEIPANILYPRGIAPIRENYKSGYFWVMPYLFYNKNNAFNEIQGDFFNVKHKNISDINILVSFNKKDDKYKNVLIVLIALSGTSTNSLNGVPISVKSSKHGDFMIGHLNKSRINKTQQRTLFIKQLDLINEYDILNKIYDDVITVEVGGQIYVFLSPELELD